MIYVSLLEYIFAVIIIEAQMQALCSEIAIE